ncbi:MAG: serine/threonine-protein kinase [Anaerolineales bacterium]|nr:MAG: serine/threonine-protein kinase [Anaerolineales bacterium]
MKPVLLNDRYRLVELVGSGGMAIVYHGEDTLLKRPVAVKVLREPYADDPAFLRRFRREAQAAAALDHSNVVRVYDVGQDGGRHYIVMEYVDGEDLKTLIRRRGRLNVDEALAIASQIAAGVGHAHQAGVIHCDIKPQNVLVTEDGRAKVADFGIARALSEAGLTDPETVWGSPLYFSPEQASGDPPTPASDVYSIGITLYEMLAGSPPFRAEKPTALALMHMRGDPPPLAARCPQVPPQLETIVRKAIAKDPGERYATAGEFGRVLDDYRRQGLEATGLQPIVQDSAPRVAVGRQANGDGPATPSGTPRQADGLVYSLGVIAAVAVLGLLPLGAWVYRIYSVPGPTGTPTGAPGTPTPTPELVRVPDVVGQPLDVAQAVLDERGFQLRVGEERDGTGKPGGTVLEQDPAADELAARGSDVSLAIASLGGSLIMPQIAGYTQQESVNYLENLGLGLDIEIEEVWSTEDEGLVIAHQPGSGGEIRAGDTVTLTLSGGFDAPILLDVNLDDKVMLHSAILTTNEFEPGDTIVLTLVWGAQSYGLPEYTVFVHLFQVIDGVEHFDGVQDDAPPRSGTGSWVPPSQYSDTHRVRIPSGADAGTYVLRVGMYPSGHPLVRLPVVDPGRTTADDDSILVVEIQIIH